MDKKIINEALPSRSLMTIEKKFEFPDIFSVTNLLDPGPEDYRGLQSDYPDWHGEELKHLYWFRQVHKKRTAEYSLCYCSNCQTDIHYQKPDGSWGYRRPKVTIPFRLFVAMCFSHFYILCDECYWNNKTIVAKKDLSGLGVPIDYLDATFDNWQSDLPFQKALLEGARHFIRDYHKTKGILLSGATGTGKTRLACTILNHLHGHFEGQIKMRFVSFHSLIQRSTISDEDYKELVNLDLLCIDDFVKKNVGFEFGKLIYPLINDRHHNNKHTIITTNLGLDEDMLKSDDENLQRLGDRFKEYICRETFSEPSQRGITK